MDKEAKDFVCRVCGSHNLEFPAYCKWNPVTQDYEFTEILHLEALCYSAGCDGGEVGEPIEKNVDDSSTRSGVSYRYKQGGE